MKQGQPLGPPHAPHPLKTPLPKSDPVSKARPQLQCSKKPCPPLQSHPSARRGTGPSRGPYIEERDPRYGRKETGTKEGAASPAGTVPALEPQGPQRGSPLAPGEQKACQAKPVRCVWPGTALLLSLPALFPPGHTARSAWVTVRPASLQAVPGFRPPMILQELGTQTSAEAGFLGAA